MTPDYPRRYDVYRADLNPTVGPEIQKTRPLVIVSRTEMNRWLDTVVVCPLTTQLHPRWRGRLQVRCAGEDAKIAADQIRSINKQRLRDWMVSLSSDDGAKLREIIREMYTPAMTPATPGRTSSPEENL